MGFFDGWDGGSVISQKSHKHHKSSSSHKQHRKRSRSRSRSKHRHSSSHPQSGGSLSGIFGADSNYQKHNSSRNSFFGLGNNNSTRSFFGMGRTNSSSFYKRSPRANFVQRSYKKLKRLLRDLIYYAKRHPMKVFMLVIMPLVTGGALTAMLARFGLRLPPGLERMLGIAAKTASGDSIGLMGEAVRMASGGFGGGGGGRADVHYERRRTEYGGGGGGDGWGSGLMGGGGFLSGIGKIFS
ncbi:Uu.00g041810.m01.CDS01 [Anthostomella pinea]|uniref:Uu.00g041810.m01.CDS01 n=1 Tax=Anthostomella pinea TaxID=933095 RepID=A0AAI8VAK8_9PEZI|nr:Uu.00g041810.m01.CDS01 [Anthostomella pinea]